MPAQAPFVLISGWTEFSRAVEQTDTVIAASAGVRLLPVGAADLDGWIQRSSRSRTKQQEWAPVLAAIAARPELPAATVLADPTLAGAARLLYTDGRAVPSELVAEDATVESLEARLVRNLFGSFSPYRSHRDADGGRLFQEQHRHQALHLLARRELEEGGAVADLRVLYRGRRPSRLQAGVHVALLVLLIWLFLGITDDSTGANDFTDSSTAPDMSGFLLSIVIGSSWYVYLRHRLNPGAAPTDPVGRVRFRLLQSIPVAAAWMLVLAFEGDSELAPLALVLVSLLLVCAVWLAEQASSRPAPRWFLSELALLPVLFFTVSLTPGFDLLLLPVFLPVLLGVTVTGHWLRAVLTSRFALWGLYPGVLLELLAEATGPEILRAGPDGWSFTHPAVARWYRDAPAGPAEAEDDPRMD
ncbi:hypothetical protein OG444_02870 [Streptomyces sp. NBC_01232]|uniref:hypothetical protein n=1 Tax=unclassified Streptomyces TaxID=2593676 RepID=UPI002E105426|nr:hypothetical protein OG444_02870 [Streptomyces sp. NBC_01232]